MAGYSIHPRTLSLAGTATRGKRKKRLESRERERGGGVTMEGGEWMRFASLYKVVLEEQRR